MKKILFLLVCVFSMMLLANSVLALVCCQTSSTCYMANVCDTGHSTYTSHTCVGTKCTYQDGGGGGNIPEFSGIGAVAAVFAIGIGTVLIRKYKKK